MTPDTAWIMFFVFIAGSLAAGIMLYMVLAWEKRLKAEDLEDCYIEPEEKIA
jgi:hypothetical protein